MYSMFNAQENSEGVKYLRKTTDDVGSRLHDAIGDSKQPKAERPGAENRKQHVSRSTLLSPWMW
jgi:hypothetical protein